MRAALVQVSERASSDGGRHVTRQLQQTYRQENQAGTITRARTPVARSYASAVSLAKRAAASGSTSATMEPPKPPPVMRAP